MSLPSYRVHLPRHGKWESNGRYSAKDPNIRRGTVLLSRERENLALRVVDNEVSGYCAPIIIQPQLQCEILAGLDRMGRDALRACADAR